MKIRSIEINNMNNVKQKNYTLSNLTYFHGRNGIGKSTILEAIQFCLLGYIPNENKTKASIFKHCNNNQMSVKLTFDNGAAITRTLAKVGNDIVSNIITDPQEMNIDGILGNASLPIFNFNDFLDLTANKMKQWFLDFLPNTTVNIDWKSRLTTAALSTGKVDDSINREIDQYIATIKSYNLSGLDEVKKANELFKEELSLKKQDLKRSTSTLQSLALSTDTTITESEEMLQDQIASYQEKNKIAAATRTKIQQNKKIYAALHSDEFIDLKDNLEDDERYIEADQELIESTKELGNLLQQQSKLQLQSSILNEVSKAQVEIEALKQSISSSNTCPILHKECKDLITQKANMQKELASRVAAYNALKAEADQYNESMIALGNNIQSAKERQEDANSVIRDLTARYDNKATYQSLLDTSISEDAEVDNTDYDSLIHEVIEKLNKLHEVKQSKALFDSMSKEVAEESSAVERLKAFEKLTGMNGLQTELTNANNPFDTLSAEMSKTLSSWLAGTPYFNIEAKANSFEFGIDRLTHKVPYTSLSTGEKCMYALSLLIALQNLSNSQLKLIMMDDAFDHLDSTNIEKVFDVLKEQTDIQIIVAGVKNTESGKDMIIEVTTEDIA